MDYSVKVDHILLHYNVVEFCCIVIFFCLIILSIVESDVLKFPIIVVICLFFLSVLSVSASHILHFCCLLYTHLGLVGLGGLILLSLHNVFSGHFFAFSEVYLLMMSLILFLVDIHIIHIFSSFCFQTVHIIT